MYTDCYFVDRESGTYSDTCATFGLAYLLSRALQDAGKSPQVELKDCGTTYLIQLAEPITPEIISKVSYPHELLPFIQDEPHHEGASHYPLGEYFGLLRSKTAESVGQSDSEQAAQLEIPDNFSVFGIIQQLQASIPKGQNSGVWDRITHRLWTHRQHYQDLMKIALAVYAESPNRLEEGLAQFRAWRKTNNIDSKAFEDKDKLVAVFNPTWQQSTNSAKPEGPKEVGYPGFWLPEFLKMVGMPHCTLVVSVQSGKKEKRKFSEEDKKIYSLSPKTIDLHSHASIMKAFRLSVRNPSSIKADIAVLLKYTEEFLLYIPRSGQRQRFGKMSDMVSGFYCAYFKKSSNKPSALSLTNLSFLQLPGWVQFHNHVPTAEDVRQYQDIIEHQRAVLFYRYKDSGKFEDFIDENQSEGCELLRYYREFLSGGSLSALLNFFANLAALIMQQGVQKKPYRQFDTSQIRRLLTMLEPSLQRTLEDEGFREVARAIRLCTVTAQRLKAKKVRTQHEIRYGLAQELKRKAPFKHEFTSAIMVFINQYQTENARYRERGGSNIHEVTTTHVRRLAALIDDCPGDSAEPVASLLLAFGYAFDDSRSEQEEEQEATDTTITDDSNQEVAP